MRKNVITILAIGSILLLIAAGVFLFAGMQKNQTEPKNWKDDFRWFDCEIALANGSKANIEIGIPLKIIDFGKTEKIMTDKSPVATVNNRYVIIRNIKDESELPAYRRLHAPSSDPLWIDNMIERQNGVEKALKLLKEQSFIHSVNGKYILFSVLRYKDVVFVSTCYGVGEVFGRKSIGVGTVCTIEGSDGNWYMLRPSTSSEEYKALLLALDYNDNKLFSDCWKKVYGKDFAEMYPFDDKNPVAKPEKKTK